MVQKKEDDMPRRRGRPRAYDPKTALARAADTFWKAGSAGASLDDLAAATGMNRPSLYAAFGDKSEIYLKTLAQYRDANRDLGRGLIGDDPPLRVFLTRFYATALDVYIKAGGRGCYSIGTAATRALGDENVRAFLLASIEGTDAFLARRFVLAHERGEISSSADPQALARLATAAMHTLAVRARAGAPRAE